MRMMTVVAVGVAVAAAILAAPTAHRQGGGPGGGQDGGLRSGKIEVGEPFPNITLPDLDGAPRSLAELRGQKVVLHVFASW